MSILKITENVYQIGGQGISHEHDCMVYLIRCEHGCVIIDTGTGLGIKNIEQNILSLGYKNGPDVIILTHCHIDHVGGASYLKKKYKSHIIANQLDVDAIEGKNSKLVVADWYGIKYKPIKVDQKISGDIKINLVGNNFELLSTPGHTPGSISVYLEIDDEKILFAQDAHGPFYDEWGSDIEQWRKSMQKLIAKNSTILCEGHFGIYHDKEINVFIESLLKSI